MAAEETAAGGAVRAFMIADVRGYTTFTAEHGDQAAAELAGAFAEIMDGVARANGGELVELRGDEALLTFASTRQALRGAIAAQGEFASRSVASPERPIRVGIGLDAGEAVAVRGGFRGNALNLAARLCSLAGPGEILASEALAHIAGLVADVAYEDRGLLQLKGFTEPVPVVEVRAAMPAAPAQPASTGSEPAPARLQIGVFLGALPSTPLVGRDEEVAELRRTLETVAGGEGRLLLLAGEPGAGKTRLAQELFLLARNGDFRLGVGSSLETREGVPYYPLLDALPMLAESLAGSLGFDPYQRWPQLRRLGGGAELAGGAGGAAEEERLRREVAAFVVAAAQVGPIGLFLDDLHWADDSTLQLLNHLARQTRDAPVLLVGTYRDVEVGRQHPLERTLRELRRDELSTTLPVRRLDQEGTNALVAATFGEDRVSDEFAGLLHGQTEGNPFFIQQVLRTLVERGDVYREGGGWQRRGVAEIELPESIRSAIGERVSRLPETTQELLATASVLGQPFRFADLLALTEQGEDALDGALAPAVESGLLRSRDGEIYGFDHALTQQTLLTEIPPRRRRRLHASAAAVLAARPDADDLAAEIALHLADGDQPSEAARWSLRAGWKAMGVYAHPEAEKHFRVAAELAGEAADEARRAEALAALGEALRTLGRLDESIETLLAAAEGFKELGRFDDEAQALAQLCTSCRERATPTVAIPPSEEFLARGASVADRPLAQLLAGLARVYWQAGRNAESGPLAERAALLADRVGDVGARLVADLTRANDRADHGHLEEARDLLIRAVAEGENAGQLTDRSAVVNNLAFILAALGDYRQNLVYRSRAMELTELFARSDQLGFATTMVGQAHMMLGDLEEAQRLQEKASKLFAGATKGGRGDLYHRAQWAWFHLAGGRLGLARELLEDVQAAMDAGGGDFQFLLWTGTLWAELLCRSGQPARAVEILQPRVERSREQGFRVSWGESWLSLPMLMVGRVAEAEALAISCTERSRGEKEATVLLEGARFLGMVRTARRDWQGADEAFRESLDLCLGAPYPWGAAWTRLEWSRSLQERGDAVRAREMETEARAGFAAMGSEPTGLPCPYPAGV